MAVTEAVENYLEAILVLKRKQPDVHAIDICNYFNFIGIHYKSKGMC